MRKLASICANSNNNVKDSEDIKELKACKKEDTKRIKELEKELARKEKALAEAGKSGARIYEACETVGISPRTYKRWYVDGEVTEDKRPSAERPEPSNKLTTEDYKSVLNVLSMPIYADSPP